MDPTENEIRTLAYEMWRDVGSPDGNADGFWSAAAKALRERKRKEAIREYVEESSRPGHALPSHPCCP